MHGGNGGACGVWKFRITEVLNRVRLTRPGPHSGSDQNAFIWENKILIFWWVYGMVDMALTPGQVERFVQCRFWICCGVPNIPRSGSDFIECAGNFQTSSDEFAWNKRSYCTTKDSIVRFTGYVHLLTLLWEKDMVNEVQFKLLRWKEAHLVNTVWNGLGCLGNYVQVCLMERVARPPSYKILECFLSCWLNKQKRFIRETSEISHVSQAYCDV